MRKNIKGVQFERWNHSHGCRKWFNVVRDTSNDDNNTLMYIKWVKNHLSK